jgi:hypothetical protein
VALAVTGILLVLLAAMAIRREEREERAHWNSHLSRLADDRLAVAERALHEWRHEAHLVASSTGVRAPPAARASAEQCTLAHLTGNRLAEPDVVGRTARAAFFPPRTTRAPPARSWPPRCA